MGCISMPQNNKNLKLEKKKRRERVCDFHSYIFFSSSVLAVNLLSDFHLDLHSSWSLELLLAACSGCCIVSAKLCVSAEVLFVIEFSSVCLSVCCNKARLRTEAGVTEQTQSHAITQMMRTSSEFSLVIQIFHTCLLET